MGVYWGHPYFGKPPYLSILTLNRYQLDAIVKEYRPRLLDSLVWIFFDFVSLHQYIRDEDQESRFKQALDNMHLLYAHEAIEVYRITLLTPQSVRDECLAANRCRWRIPVFWEEEGKVMLVPVSKLHLNQTPYDDRGWCQAEAQWAALRASLKDGNPVPLPPDMFRSQMTQLQFTHRDDAGKVFELQEKIFREKTASTTRLLVEDLDDAKLATLVVALPFYSALKELVVNASSEHAWKVALGVVESGASDIQIECGNLRDEDAVALAADLSRESGRHLERLHLKCADIGELGRNALQQMREHHDSVSRGRRGPVDLVIEVSGSPRTTLCIVVAKREGRELREAKPLAAAAILAGSSASLAPLTVRCLEGSTFQLHVDSVETGWDVQRRVAGRVGRSAESIVLTSGDRVLDPCQPLLQQAQDREVTYVIRKLGAGYAVRCIERAFAGNALAEDTDAKAEIVALTFGVFFNQSFEGLQLPSGLQTLTFGVFFNQSLEGLQFPSSLQTLTFGRDFNQSLEGLALPSGLQTLTFGDKFSQSLTGVQLPSGLQTLTFGGPFNEKQSLKKLQLPSGLQTLTFGDKFNQSLEGLRIPSVLRTLTFGHDFNQSLEGLQLPSGLQTLTFGCAFNQSLEGLQIPSGLQTLTFGDKFNQSLTGLQLPSGLQTLTFGCAFNQSLEGLQLPSGLQTLAFGRDFNQSLDTLRLPSGLQILAFGDKFNQSLAGLQLPSGLQTLTFGDKFNQSLEGLQLPSGLRTLTFGVFFNQSLEGLQFPSGLQTLTFGRDFNQSLEGLQLPSGLQTLTFGEKFNQSLEGLQLPSGLQTLTFGEFYNQSLEGLQLRSSLLRVSTRLVQVDTA